MLVFVANSCAVIFVQIWGAIEPHIEAKNNAFSTTPQKFVPAMTSQPVPDVAQIVARTFFHLHIKFEAELYACWVCRASLSRIAYLWLSIAPHFVYESDRRKKIVYDIMT